MTGSAGPHCDTGLAREPAPRIPHMHGGRFVPAVHEIELRLDRGVEDRHDVIARKRENAVRAKTRKRLRNDVGASERLVVVDHSVMPPLQIRRELRGWSPGYAPVVRHPAPIRQASRTTLRHLVFLSPWDAASPSPTPRARPRP